MARPGRRTAGVLLAAAVACGALVGTTAPAASASVPAEPAPPAVPHPFGLLTCVPEGGIRVCNGGLVDGRDRRVPSFDGVPLDADLALPATGRGPFPLIVLLHGLGESKSEFETGHADGGVDEYTMAEQGYAVLMYTARGFGDSCGTAASRQGVPACARGWIQLADQRYEVRDTQYLAGMLVDEGLVRPDIAVSGVSYGAGQSLELAMLKNRMELPSGRFVPFTSPHLHVPMAVAAAYAMWPWDDLDTALVPNGHLTTAAPSPARVDQFPVGVAKQSWISLLYATTASNYLAPPGVDPQSDLTVWDHEILAGEPYRPSDARALRILARYKSAIGIPMAPGGPAPTSIQSGWTDTLFPVSEALHYANRVRAAGDRTPLLLMFDDVGHGWAQDKTADIDDTNRRGIAFLNAVMLHHSVPASAVVTRATTCPATAPSGSDLVGATLGALQGRPVVLGGSAAQTVTSWGGSPATAQALEPAYAGQNLCDPLPAADEPGTAVYQRPVGPSPVTLLGAPTVTARLAVRGRYPEVVGRLWDVDPATGQRQIVALGVYRPAVHQLAGSPTATSTTATVRFELDPNEYTFAAGHTVELELVGSNAPFFRRSNGTFTLSVSGLRLALPTARSAP